MILKSGSWSLSLLLTTLDRVAAGWRSDRSTQKYNNNNIKKKKERKNYTSSSSCKEQGRKKRKKLTNQHKMRNYIPLRRLYEMHSNWETKIVRCDEFLVRNKKYYNKFLDIKMCWLHAECTAVTQVKGTHGIFWTF